MLKMNKRGKDVNWSKFANASPKPKRLHLEEDDCDGLFHCPVQICNHEGFATQRGCRKHVKNKHSWYYYFDEKPDSAQIEKLNVDETSKCEASDQKITPRKSRTIASFDPKNKITKNFFFRGSLAVVGAVKLLGCHCRIGGLSKSEWSIGIGIEGLTSTEIYLKKVRKTVSKMMRLQWTSELDIDALEAKGHWATLEELLEVVGRYLPRYESVLKSCKEKPGAVLPIDLSFATKFVAVYLFIKYLTVEMVNKAKTNGGFVDQKMFKTAGKYGFDSLYLTETSMQVLDGYINHIRPLLRPTCDFVLVTRNGGQHQKLGGLMSKLVFDATGKYVHPTRYRQIVETASSRQLSSSAQSTISEDQKYSSVVARVHYQKQRSREVASKAHEYL
ncbi:unnamed protein product, partial [Porites lobata]